MSEAIKAVWVVGEFEGDRAKSVLAHAEAGIGYFILERGGSDRNPTCTAVFLRATDQPPAPWLNEVTDQMKIDKYNRLREARK